MSEHENSEQSPAARPAEAGEWVRLCVRPEDVTLSARVGDSPSSARNQLAGRVVTAIIKATDVMMIGSTDVARSQSSGRFTITLVALTVATASMPGSRPS